MSTTYLSVRAQWACAIAAVALTYLQTASIAAGILSPL